MIVRKLRLQRSWSQEQLSEYAKVSVRTIQRIERGQKMGLSTAKALASVFEVEASDLINGEDIMNEKVELKQDEKKAMEYVKGLKEFYSHLFFFITFAIAIPVFKGFDKPIILFGLLGWGVGVIIHGLVAYEVFNFIGTDWEKRQIEKRLNRKL